MCATINLYRGTLACSKLHHTFFLKSDPQGNVLLDGVSLDQSIHIIPPGVHSNISSATFSLHFITMDGFDPPVCHATPSHDTLFMIGFSKVVSLES